jgi:signal transduction protein with GAF and PtsI domain
VGLCGELAGEPLAASCCLAWTSLAWLGCSISLVKQIIRRYASAQAREIVQHVLTPNDIEAVKVYLKGLVW